MRAVVDQFVRAAGANDDRCGGAQPFNSLTRLVKLRTGCFSIVGRVERAKH
jgi:hypothetical protein